MTIFGFPRTATTRHGLIRRPAAHPVPHGAATAPAVTGRQWPGRKSPVPACLAAVPVGPSGTSAGHSGL